MSTTQDPDAREVRAAQNQSVFREINERIKGLNETFSTLTRSGDWVCECANESCTERIEMTLEEYEAIRAESARFFIAPADEHLWPDVEEVTGRTDRYWVVEKRGESGRIARDADPRLHAVD